MHEKSCEITSTHSFRHHDGERRRSALAGALLCRAEFHLSQCASVGCGDEESILRHLSRRSRQKAVCPELRAVSRRQSARNGPAPALDSTSVKTQSRESCSGSSPKESWNQACRRGRTCRNSNAGRSSRSCSRRATRRPKRSEHPKPFTTETQRTRSFGFFGVFSFSVNSVVDFHF